MPNSKAAKAYDLLAAFCCKMPLPILNSIIENLSWVYQKLNKKNDLHVVSNLNQLSKHLNRDLSSKHLDVYKHFGWFLIEFFRAHKYPPQPLPDTIIKDTLNKMGRPGEQANLILVGHYGNWEIALKHVLNMGYKVTTIAMKHSDCEVDAFFSKMRHHPNLTVRYLEDGFKYCIKAMRNKEVVALACERDYTENGHPVSIAGAQVPFPKGPATLIKKYKPNVFFGECIRRSLNQFDMQLVPFRHPDQEEVDEITQAIANQLFDLIYKHPEQWITFDDFFQLNK